MPRLRIAVIVLILIKGKRGATKYMCLDRLMGFSLD